MTFLNASRRQIDTGSKGETETRTPAKKPEQEFEEDMDWEVDNGIERETQGRMGLGKT